MKTPILVLVLAVTLVASLPAAGDPEGLLDEASRARDQVQSYYLRLQREIWMESHDLDHMPPPLTVEQSNLGPGPIAYVQRAFAGQDLRRRQFLRNTWIAEARDLDGKLTRLHSQIKARHATIQGKTRDQVDMDENGNSVFSFSDPALAQADRDLVALAERIEELARREREVLDRVAVGNALIQAELKTAQTSEPGSGATAVQVGGPWRITLGYKDGQTSDWEMVLSQSQASVSGTYTLQGGTVDGTLAGRTVTGKWSNGTRRNSGTFTWNFAPDGRSFTGTYKIDGSPGEEYSWTGTRTR